jgi:hypothetical protein
MPKKSIPTNLLEQATNMKDVLSHMDPTLSLGKTNVTALIKDIDTLRGIESDLVSIENQLKTVRDQRDVLQKSLWQMVKSGRSAIKGIYGDDSLEYALVGGTRMSARKSPRRTAPPLE